MDSLASIIAGFSFNLCKELDKEKSIVSSPLSAEYLLALLTLGSVDAAHTELLTTLGFPDNEAILSSFSSLSSHLKAISGVTLNVANKIYIKDGKYDLQPAIKRDVLEVFDANIEKVDFRNREVAADLINKWVESKTNGKIRELLTSDSIDNETSMILVNAIYFKGAWKLKFDVNNTADAPFYITAEKTKSVHMMRKEDNYRYCRSDVLQAELLEMPYQGDDSSMLIILPNEIEGVDGVLQKLADKFDLIAEIDKMFSKKVEVHLPRFKIETKIDLTNILQKLGIKEIFDEEKCSLPKIINSNELLYVSEAIQKAFIEVNEEGAEAAAATGKRVIKKKCIRYPIEFRADRPFIFLLIGLQRIIYFIGVYRGDVEKC